MSMVPTISFGNYLTLDEVKKAYVLWVLEQHDSNRTKAALSLKIGARTLQRLLKKEGINP